MIKLTKTAIPSILSSNGNAWTQTILAKIAAGIKPTDAESSRYRHPDVKTALVTETKGKCAYCESKVKHIHHGDVEHIVPKSLDPSKRFEWENLTLACEICNQNKSDRDPNTEYIIDPYRIDPKEHLIFAGSMIFPLGTEYGKNSTTLLELNRSELVEIRKSRLEKIMLIINQILDDALPIVTRRIIYKNLLDHECSSDAEFSAMCDDVVNSIKWKIPQSILQ